MVTTWTLAVASAANQYVSPMALSALFFTVWAIYLIDRMIDVARCQYWSSVSGRMAFGRDFKSLFFTCLGLCCAVLILVMGIGVPADVFFRGLFVAAGMVVYFLLFVMPVWISGKLPG